MAQVISGDLFLGASNTGLTLTIALKDDDGVAAAGLTSPTVFEVAGGTGSYHYHFGCPDGHRGLATFSSGATYKTHVTLNPDETVNAYQRNLIADHVLTRDWSAVTLPEASRCLWQATRFLRNFWVIIAGVLSVKKEDDTTEAWSGAVSTDAAGLPITGLNPS